MFWNWIGLKPRFVELPQELFRYDTGKPFEHCMVCNAYLLEDNTQYIIEKAIRQHQEYKTQDVVFEYAICLSCYEEISQKLSKDSKKKIAAYIKEHVNMPKRWRSKHNDNAGAAEYLQNCWITDTPREDLSEYQIAAHCNGPDLVLTFMPYLLSGEAMNEMSALLSNETLGEIDNFTDTYLGMPSELKDLFKTRPVFM